MRWEFHPEILNKNSMYSVKYFHLTNGRIFKSRLTALEEFCVPLLRFFGVLQHLSAQTRKSLF